MKKKKKKKKTVLKKAIAASMAEGIPSKGARCTIIVSLISTNHN